MKPNIKQFHINYGYFIKVKPISNLIGCVVEFPSNIINNIKVNKTTKTYIINYDYKLLELYQLIEGKKILSREIKVHPYNVRVLVIGDILLQAARLNISPELVLPMDDNNKELDINILHMLKIDLSKHYSHNEKLLFGLIKDINAGKTDHDIDNDILDGYQQVVQCFVNGGI